MDSLARNNSPTLPDVPSNFKEFEQLADNYSLVRSQGKAPLEKGWERYSKKKRSFKEIGFRPGDNAGIACGPASNLLALDIDHPVLFQSVLNRYGWGIPQTRIHLTGSGKAHLLFNYPRDGKRYGNRTFKTLGFDLRGHGGVIVAPGSTHPETGKPYRVLVHTEQADPPEWLLEFYRERKPEWSAIVLKKLRIQETTMELIENGAERGQRSEAIMTVLNALVGAGLSDDQIYYVFYTYPIGEKFMEVDSNRDQWLKPQIDKAKGWVRTYSAPAAKSVPAPQGFTAAQLVKMEIPEPKWAVPGLLPEGLTILGGKPKIGKSLFALNIAIAIATGGTALEND